MSEFPARQQFKLSATAFAITIALLAGVASIPFTSFGQGKKPAGKNDSANWEAFGRDVSGSHYNADETKITPANVAQLKPKWVFTTEGDVSSQPLAIDGVLYFGSWDGHEYAVNAKTGEKIWAYDCGQSSRGAAAYARDVDGGTLFFTDMAGLLHALDAKTGTLKWKKKIDKHGDTVGTSSPVYYQGRIYVGVASHEEGWILKNPNYPCCNFRGNVVAYDAKTGNEVWRFFVIPEEPKEQGKDKRGRTIVGPAGGAVWSTVSIDPATKRVYLTTGNQYTQPVSKFCNAIIALDIDTGKAVWSYQATPRDIWTFGCRDNPDCDDLDFDFGTAPVFLKGKGGKRLVAAGQKSGWAYALSLDGKLEWSTEVGPGGKLGGIEFGLASDGERVYAAISNHPKQGSVSALDGVTGKILWQTKSPDNKANFGPVTVTGKGDSRLVWAGSQGGFVRAYDARDGKIVWEFDTGASVGGGVTVVDGVAYVGSGYTFLRIGKANNKLYAFSVDGK